MATSNVKAPAKPVVYTGGGGRAIASTALVELRRSCLAALLFENIAYEDGSAHAKRIAALVDRCDPEEVAALAIEAREDQHLRHLPLYLVVCLGKHPHKRPGLVRRTLARVIQRPDEITEFAAIYWTMAGRKLDQRRAHGTYGLPISMRRGINDAFRKFDAYALGKYRSDDKAVKLVDLLKMARPKPKNPAERALWGALRRGTLKHDDTWESELSAGADKTTTWTRLLKERKLGGLALLRNLRNMEQAGVDRGLITEAIDDNPFRRVLPFRFIAAMPHAPRYVGALDRAMQRALAGSEKLTGHTVLVLDVSGSMGTMLSGKSDMNRLAAAGALGVLIRGVCESASVYATAGSDLRRIHATELLPDYQGMALMEKFNQATSRLGGGGIFLVQCLEYIKAQERQTVDRLIVLTDEQDCDTKLTPDKADTFGRYNYLVNVSVNQYGVGHERWTKVNGWSESLVDFIRANERFEQRN